MNLYLLRHAHALAIGEQGIQTDEARPLSDEGRQQMELVGDAVKRLGLKIDLLLSSPLRRAMESAQELCRRLGLSGTALMTCDQLEPGGSLKKLMKRLRSLEANEVVLVGHTPDLPWLAAWLIGSKRTEVEIAKAGLACIRCDAPPRKGVGALVWLLTPELLRALKPV
ncbi:MAG TPA: phosphohistidine phosphatase SixA [Gemmataceae bacterium]|nr:phosphohistidine phosphatase SixA [Gemmataceae bacterium]